LQYSRDGDDIELSLERERGWLLVGVTDTGPGIEREALERVFHRFYRGEQARRCNPAGSGLGLAVARSIVRAHGGEIGIDSTPGTGTRVTVRLLEEASRRAA
jgi:signal transduction histidine kinase